MWLNVYVCVSLSLSLSVSSSSASCRVYEIIMRPLLQPKLGIDDGLSIN